MGNLYGVSGSTHYIMSQDSDEAFSFNAFGEGIGSIQFLSAYAEVAKCVVNVDVVSVLGSSLDNWCEVFLNGRVVEIPRGYLEVYKNLPVKGRASHIVYRVAHGHMVTQVLVIYEKGMISERDISNGTWSEC